MKLILIHGGNTDTPNWALMAGWGYGIREDYTPYAMVGMVDFDWKKPVTPERWARYLDLIRQHTPRQAMAPDYEHPRQWQALKRQIVDIRKAGAERVMVTPKFDGALERLPRWDVFVIGISVPTGYAGFLPLPGEVAGRDLHFLGGHPDQWVYLRRIYEAAGARVVSADSNVAVVQAREYGKYWSAKKGGYVEMRGEGFETEWLAIASMSNTRDYLSNPPASGALINDERVQKCVRALQRQPRLIDTEAA